MHEFGRGEIGFRPRGLVHVALLHSLVSFLLYTASVAACTAFESPRLALSRSTLSSAPAPPLAETVDERS